MGQCGDGPGEFRHLGGIGWLADTLWAYDGRSRRLTLYGPDLVRLRDFELPAEARPAPGDEGRIPPYRDIAAYALLPDGWIAASLSSPMGSGAPEHLDPTLFQWFRVRLRDGRIGAPIAHLRAADDRGKGYYVDTSGGGFFGRTFPFQGGEKYAVSDDGAWLAVAEDEEPREEESAFRLTLVRTSGEQVYAGRYRVQTGTIPSSMIDSVLGAGFDAIVNSRSSRLSGSRLRAIART